MGHRETVPLVLSIAVATLSTAIKKGNGSPELKYKLEQPKYYHWSWNRFQKTPTPVEDQRETVPSTLSTAGVA